MRCVGSQCGWMREERRCRMVVPFASRSPKQTPHFDPTRRERPIAGALRRCRFAYWYAPTALTTPCTVPAISLSHVRSSVNRPYMKALFGSRPELARVRREGFARGIRTVAPLLIGTGIWGLVTGVAMVKVGLTTAQAIAMTLLVFSGTVQLASLPLIAADAPLWVVMLTAVVVNLRFVIFSAGLHPFFRRFSMARRWLLSYFMVDMSFAMFLSRFADAPHDQRGTTEQVWFFLGMSAGSWIVWQTMSIIGIVLAAEVPAQWGLEFTAILALIAMTLPLIVGKPALVGAVTAGVIAVAAAGLPLKLGLLVAVVAGIAAAMATEIMLERRSNEAGGTT